MEEKISRNFNRSEMLKWFINNIAWVILFLTVAVFSVTISNFFSIQNLINIAYHAVFVGVLAIGETYVMITKNMDLSIESVAAFSAILSSWLCSITIGASGLHMNTLFGLAIVLILGAIIGLFNAFLIVNCKINSFIATLASYIIFRAIAILLTSGRSISGLPYSFRAIATISFYNIPILVILVVVMYLVFNLILTRTSFGLHLYILGGNESAAYNFGINIKKLVYKVFIISGVVSSFAGWLIAARVSGSTPAVASGMLFEVMAAVVIGGVSITGGYGNLWGVMAGVILLTAIRTALNILDVSPYLVQVLRGVLIIVAVLIDSLKRFFGK